jgi:hypothetical protein
MKFKDLDEPNQLQVKFHYLCSLLVGLVHGSIDDSPLPIHNNRVSSKHTTFVELDYCDPEVRDLVKLETGEIVQSFHVEQTRTSWLLRFFGKTSQDEDDTLDFLLATITDDEDFYSIDLNDELSLVAYANLENPLFLELVSLTVPLATDLGYSQKKITQDLNKLTVIYHNTNKLWV